MKSVLLAVVLLFSQKLLRLCVFGNVDVLKGDERLFFS